MRRLNTIFTLIAQNMICILELHYFVTHWAVGHFTDGWTLENWSELRQGWDELLRVAALWDQAEGDNEFIL